MPRQADHDERRHQIATAVWRLAARGGLEEVSLRRVAAEAGVSPRLLQYYFGTRQQLLLGSLEILNAEAQARAEQRVGALGATASLRDVMRTVLLELLPLDEERRTRHLMYAVYFVRFLTDPDLQAIGSSVEPAMQTLVADLLRQAIETGEITSRVDPAAAAEVLVAIANGLQAQMLLEQTSAADGIATIDYELGVIFAREGMVRSRVRTVPPSTPP